MQYFCITLFIYAKGTAPIGNFEIDQLTSDRAAGGAR
jgi:hypothetical protein